MKVARFAGYPDSIGVKANQPELLEALRTWFEDPDPFIKSQTVTRRCVEKGHGRLVRYTISTTAALNDYLQRELHEGCAQLIR